MRHCLQSISVSDAGETHGHILWCAVCLGAVQCSVQRLNYSRMSVKFSFPHRDGKSWSVVVRCNVI